MEPSREDLLELLVSGSSVLGGAKRGRKKPVPAGLKKWHAFRKKHPNLTIKQQSRLYKKQGHKKGRGMEEEEEFGDIEGFGMLGGAKRKFPKASSKAWQTKTVRGNKKLIKLGATIVKALKSNFPKEYGLLKKSALGSGVDFEDYMSFVSNQRKEDPTVVGVALRKAWDEAVQKGTKAYYTDYEQALLAIGSSAYNGILGGSQADVKNLIYLLETQDERDPQFA